MRPCWPGVQTEKRSRRVASRQRKHRRQRLERQGEKTGAAAAARP